MDEQYTFTVAFGSLAFTVISGFNDGAALQDMFAEYGIEATITGPHKRVFTVTEVQTLFLKDLSKPRGRGFIMVKGA